MEKDRKRKNKKNSEKAVTPVISVTEGGSLIRYKRRNLRINQRVFEECMKLHPASERTVDQVYITEKKRLSRMLQDGDCYEDMIWLLCERIRL